MLTNGRTRGGGREGGRRHLTDPRKGQGGSVMVLMQENDFSLFQDEDDRIQKLVPFDQIVLGENEIASAVSGPGR
jgi:hypothetical protein